MCYNQIYFCISLCRKIRLFRMKNTAVNLTQEVYYAIYIFLDFITVGYNSKRQLMNRVKYHCNGLSLLFIAVK